MNDFPLILRMVGKQKHCRNKTLILVRKQCECVSLQVRSDEIGQLFCIHVLRMQYLFGMVF